VGWGLAIEEDDPGRRTRVVSFVVSVCVLASLGLWIFVSSVLSSGVPLAANGAVPSGGAFAVKLFECAAAMRASWDRIAATPEMQSLAGPSSFRWLELSDGQWCMCVGQSEDPDSPELRRLLREFSRFETSSGIRPFRSCVIHACPE
jgi:hypothetical protein